MDGDNSTNGNGASTSSSEGGGSRKRSAHSTNPSQYRSVVDFDTEDELREAMLTFLSDVDGDLNGGCSAQLSALLGEIQDGQPVQKVVRSGELAELACGYDWVLPTFDEETQNPQTVQDELQRLQVMKSYLVVDSKRDEAFDRITQLATRIFDVPVSMISLVDLGRQYYMSTHGLDKYGLQDLNNIPRNMSFCAQTILNKSNVLVVPDMSKDFRFLDNPFVSGPPFCKLYAGASLITPEGYRLGSVCILDTVARPNGLSEEECATLSDLAEMTMKVMIDRRYKLNKQKESPSQLMAYTAHDILAPLTSVHLSLSILNSDPSITEKLANHQLELLNTATSCSELMIRICNNWEGGRQSENEKLLTDTTTSKIATGTSSNATKDNVPLTNLKDLVKNLNMTVNPIPKHVPCIVTLDKEVPSIIVGDDLKLFRCAVNLLTNAIDRTITGIVHLTIRWDGEALLLFECEDTGPDIPVDEYQYLFQRENDDSISRVGLSSIAILMDSMDGEYGFRPKGVDSCGNVITDVEGHRMSGSIFWFSLPLLLPEMLENADDVSPRDAQSHENLEPYPLSLPPDMYSQQQQGSIVGTYNDDANVIDELNKLAQDLNASLTDFEPYPVNAGSYKTTAQTTMRRRRALVIDDSIVVRRSLTEALHQFRFEVTQAVDGTEGLVELQKTLYDVVFCDFIMPVMDGVTCVSQYRVWEQMNRPWDRQLIIGISANASINNNGQGLHAGMNAFLPKPITVKTLSDLDCSSEVVQRTRQLDELEGVTTSHDYFDAAGNIGREQSRSATGTLPPLPPLQQPLSQQNSTSQLSCLIASNVVSSQRNTLPQQLESMGWKVVVEHDGVNCLGLLKLQQWAAVLVEDDLMQLSGMLCVSTFRKWEGMNGIPGRQKNVFYVCDDDIPSPLDGSSWIQPPIGFDGVLRKPVPWIDLQCMLMRSNNEPKQSSIANVGSGYRFNTPG